MFVRRAVAAVFVMLAARSDAWGQAIVHRASGSNPATPTRPARRTSAHASEDHDAIVVRSVERRGHVASEYNLPIGLLSAVPRQNATDLLTLVPGVSLSNEATEGDAPEVYLRGFAGDNGSAIAFTLEGVPLNDVGHPRTEGYADVLFVIPELVERLNASEGLGDPRAGNFALAGAIDYRLGLRHRGIVLRGAYGTHGYGRFTTLFGPPDASDRTLAAVDLVRGDGFGPSRNYERASALGQHAWALGDHAEVRTLVSLYAARYVSPGPLREDDLTNGRVSFFDAAPNAPGQGGHSMRALLVSTLEVHGPRERAEIGAWIQGRDVETRDNLTGFLEHPQTGDLRGSNYTALTLGGRGFYRRGVGPHDVEAGFFVRHDRFATTDRALDGNASGATAHQGLSDEEDADLDARVTNLALYLDTAFRPARWLTMRGGVRADVFAYDVDVTSFDAGAMAFARAQHAVWAAHLSPKGTIAVRLGAGFEAVASIGSGFRTPDVRRVGVGPEAVPLARALTEEAGVRFVGLGTAGDAARLIATATAFHTTVENDAVFDPREGDEVAVGPTRRMGASLWVRARPLAWIDVNASVTYARATVERGAFDGALAAGSELPYMPSVVARLDAAAEHEVGVVRGVPVLARGGVGVGVRGPRPLLGAGGDSPAVALVDAGAGVRVGPFSLDLNARNLLDTRWRETESEYASNFSLGAPSSPVPARHFTAGAPLMVFATASVAW